jgi:hypothetical protein
MKETMNAEILKIHDAAIRAELMGFTHLAACFRAMLERAVEKAGMRK